MAIVKKLQKFGRLPTSMIVNGGGFLGVSLAESLLEQTSKVIIIDEFTEENEARVKHLMESDLFTFADFSLLDSIADDPSRIDYIFYFNHDLSYRSEEIDTRYFKTETDKLEKTLQIAVKKKAKFLYATSMEVNRYIASQAQDGEVSFKRTSGEINYTMLELQRYGENLVTEFHRQSGLNSRIIRLGEVFGEGMDVDRDSDFARLLNSAVKKKKIRILGEGLQTRYYLHVLDATYGLIKAQFGHNTNGEVFSLANPEEISELSLAYKVLEFNPNANEVEFIEVDRRVYPSRISIPAENLSVIGWTPHIDFEKGLFKTLAYFYQELNVNWRGKPEKEEMGERPERRKPLFARKQKEPEPKGKEEVEETKGPSKEKPPEKKEEPKESEEEQIIKDKTKRIVEVTKKSDDEEAIVRVLPIREDSKIRGSILKQITSIPKSVKDPNIVSWLIRIAILIPIVIFIIFPILQLVVFTSTGGLFAALGYRQVGNMRFDRATWSFTTSATYFTRASESLTYFEKPAGWVGLDGAYTQSAHIYSMAEHLSAAAKLAVFGMEPWVKYFQTFNPLVNPNDTSAATATSENLSYKDTLDEMSDSSTDLVAAASEFKEAKNAYSSINKNKLPGFARSFLARLDTELDESAAYVDKAASVVEYVPDLLGKDGRKTYLILFQNPLEMRSTGGWIGGYGIVSVEEGQLRRLDVNDIYNADGKLQVNNKIIDPPDDMQEALGIRQWTLSLSNWKPDFQFAAKDAEYLTREILDVADIDGVVTIDLYVLQDLLGIIGEVNVGGQEGPVNADNLFEKTLKLREGFTPGSQQKSSFLGRLSSVIMDRLIKLTRDKWPAVGTSILSNLDEKHILLAFDNPQASREMVENNWGSSLSSGVITDEACEMYLYPVDYNWSGNKVNAYVERSSDIDMTIGEWDKQEGEANVQVIAKVAYENKSNNDSYEGGQYDNYLRVYLPNNAQVISVSGFEDDEVEIYKEFGRTAVSGWVRVLPGGTAEVSIDFDFTWKEPTLAGKSRPDLGICVQKQPGFEKEKTKIYLRAPKGLMVYDKGNFSLVGEAYVREVEFNKDLVEKFVFQQ